MSYSPLKRLCAEALGTALLLAIIVGSGIMAERLCAGNIAIALWVNVAAISAGLVVLIHIFGPISGAHFNPVVTLIMWLRKDIRTSLALGYVVMQTIGAIGGTLMANIMFDHAVVEISTHVRSGNGLIFSEAVASFGLIATILAVSKFKPDFTPMAVGLYISSSCWFSASTSFVNPAVSIARAFTQSFTGIAPQSVPAFIVAQLIGSVVAYYLFNWLLQEKA